MLLRFFALLLLCQLIGEAFVAWTGLPIPGPVVGMALLFLGLTAKGEVPDGLSRVVDGLLSHLSLLFVPAGVGGMLRIAMLRQERRCPEHTILYQIIQQHLEADLRLAREDDWDGERVPAAALDRPAGAGLWVTGIPPRPRMRHPGLRLRPDPLSPVVLTGDGHDFLVAFSCKGRTVCPSCNARPKARERRASGRSCHPAAAGAPVASI